ncbi:hypothetical protein R0J91_21970, partial [Micrococcus sp. SIMBA_131]
MVVVEQNVSMALEVADRGYVMASGRIAASGTAAELRNSDTLQAAYLGADYWICFYSKPSMPSHWAPPMRCLRWAL